jgi:hypothetical protein
MPRACFALILIASLGTALHAQAPAPTTAQLVAQVTALEQEVARLTALCSPPVGAPTDPTGLSSLALAAAAAAKTTHAWPLSTNTGQSTTMPQPATEATVPSVDSSTTFVPKSGPTADQLHELDLTEARTTLRKAQQALREGEDAQLQLQRSHDSTCHEHGGRLPLELIRPCADMEFAISHTGPAALARLRVEIRKLAIALDLDPEAAVRTSAVR